MADTKVADETELTAFGGDEVFYLVDDPSGTPLDRKARVAHFIPDGGRLTFYDSADTYNVNYGLTTGSTAALGTNRLYMIPVFINPRRAVTTLAAVCTALQGTSSVRLGLYNANQSTGHPTTLIQEPAAVIDVSTGTGATGLKTLTISQTLNPAWYFLAAVTDGSPTFSTVGGAYAPLGGALTTAYNAVYGLFRAFTYAALPADESAQTYSTTAGTSIPIIGIR